MDPGGSSTCARIDSTMFSRSSAKINGGKIVFKKEIEEEVIELPKVLFIFHLIFHAFFRLRTSISSVKGYMNYRLELQKES